MGLYESDHPDVPGMKGLHLFHFVISNCPERIRLDLEEKRLAWTSHYIEGSPEIMGWLGRMKPYLSGMPPMLPARVCKRDVPPLSHDD